MLVRHLMTIVLLLMVNSAVAGDWYRGNTHTHTTRGDGDSSPEKAILGNTPVSLAFRSSMPGPARAQRSAPGKR
jgi:hypothetical protein